MIENFIDDDYLKKFHPNIQLQLWADLQSDYSTQINKAFDMLINDLHNKGIDIKQVMLSKDLLYESTDDDNTPLKSATITATTTGAVVEGYNERRLVIVPTAVTGTWTIKIQGNNATEEPASDDARWTDVVGASITVDGTQKRSIVFNEQYRWYRYVATLSDSGSLTFGVYLIETILDDVIAYGAFTLIFTDFILTAGDRWDILRQQDIDMYNRLLDNARFSYDADEDGIVDSDETETNVDIRLKR